MASTLYIVYRSRIHEHTILLRFLGIILRVLRLEVSVYNVSHYKPVSNPFCLVQETRYIILCSLFVAGTSDKAAKNVTKARKLALQKIRSAISSGRHTFISVWNRAGHKMLWGIRYFTIFITIWTLLIKFCRETFYANSLRRINTYVLCMKMRSSREWMRSSSRAWIRPSRVWMR